MKGIAAAGVGAVGVAVGAGAAAGAAPDTVGVALVLGARSLTMIAGFWSSLPLMTKIAGRSLVAPPCGISATARCRPGLMRTGATPCPGATPVTCSCGAVVALAGCPSSRVTPCRVARSLARTGWYWPDGHHAQARIAASAAPAAITAARRDGLLALHTPAFLTVRRV